MHSSRAGRWARLLLAALLLAVAVGAPGAGVARAAPDTPSYTNPLPVDAAHLGRVGSCPDPAIIRSQQPGDPYWYMYCTSDPLNDADRLAGGFHYITMHRSQDLVHWTYVGDAFTAPPAWTGGAWLWAPDIRFFNGQYYLYYSPAWTADGGGAAIGVATGPTPMGPWTDSGGPVVEPQPHRYVIDPAVVEDAGGRRYLFFGSGYGGIAARALTADGLRTDPASEQAITSADRYEGAFVVRRGGYYYLFVSSGNCCGAGPLTGYSVFAGRATSVLGPYVDREGVPLLAGQVGGTPVLSLNGNRWVGTGHNAIFTDLDGQDWLLYHAVDRTDPYFEGAPGYNKRPPLLDPLAWVDGWPAARAGLWASDTPQPAPAAQPGQKSRVKLQAPREARLGALLAEHSDEFAGAELGGQWVWVRPPAPGEYGVAGGGLRFQTQATDLTGDNNSASVLTAPAPTADYLVEVKVHLDVPPEGCCYGFAQAGLLVYGDDDNYIKLDHVAIWGTRQTEFGKEWAPVPWGYWRKGEMFVGPPGEWTWLRLARRAIPGSVEQQYTAYTSRDGVTWVRGGTWTHTLGPEARLGLFAMGGSGFTATFDYVRFYTLRAP